MIHNFEEENVFDESMKFGEYMRKKRRLLGLNQSDFADILGHSQKTVCAWELGTRTPPFDEAMYIIRFLGGEVKIENRKSFNECKSLLQEILVRFPYYPVNKIFFGD